MTEPEKQTSPKSGNPQERQSLTDELKKIAAQTNSKPEGETVVFYDSEHPENVTIETEAREESLQKEIGELQEQLTTALLDFRERIGLIDTEARGEEHMAIDTQFVRTVAIIRERAIDLAPDLADQFWRTANEARSDELAALDKLATQKDRARNSLTETITATTARLSELVERAKEGELQAIDAATIACKKELSGGLTSTERELVQIPRSFGEIEDIMDGLVQSFSRLIQASEARLSDDEVDDFKILLREKLNDFQAYLTERAKHERERIKILQDEMHRYYSGPFDSKLRQATSNIEAQK